ncbi:MAG: T9SS type A sorting domain-containing protein [Prolixibacteraceae bacterium]|nr:T9SS type A sorting domain-containing protein [Prolixibacteraceae bacterium]
MKHIYLLFMVLLLSLSSTAEVLEKTKSTDTTHSQQIKETFQNYISAKNNTEATEFSTKLFDLLKETRASNSKDSQNILKSNTNKSHKLDSLLAQRWNEKTGQPEPSQLEKWTWDENGNGKFWELYDKDTLTGQWNPNDKEEYKWDENGNKITHIDYDPDSLTGGWRKNATEDYTYNVNGDETSYLLQLADQSTGEMVNIEKIVGTYDYAENIMINTYQDYDTITNEWINTNKQTYSIDSDGNITFDYLLGEEWNSTLGKWDTVVIQKRRHDEYGNTNSYEIQFPKYLMYLKTEITFDKNGKKTLQTDYAWDVASSQFVYDSKYENEYNATGNIIKTINSVWDSTENVWETVEIKEFEYDSLDYLISENRYEITSNTSLPISKIEYSNNNSGLVSNKVSYNWNTTDSAWVKNNQYHYKYNRDEMTTYEDQYIWDETTGNWVGEHKQNYTFDTNGKTLYQDRWVWDTITNSWIGEFKQTKSYNTNGKLTYEDNWIWDIKANSWIGEYKENLIYAVNGNYIMENRWIWDTDKNGWIAEYQYDFSYDLSTLFSDIIFPPDYSYGHISNLTGQKQYSNMMTQRTSSELKDGQLSPTETITLYYSENTASGKPHLTNKNLKVYPNPATDFVMIDTGNNTPATINLYTIQGQKSLSKSFTGNIQLSLDQLRNQIYIYEIIQDDKISSGKFIKVR